MSIYFNNSSINDWNYDTLNVIKVYRNNAIVFYKVSGGSPTPEHTVIDYIQVSSDNTNAALVLDYIPTASSCYEIDMQTIKGSGTPHFIGQKIDGTEYVSYQFGFCWYSKNTHWFYDYGGGRFSGYNTEASFSDRRLWRIGWQDNKLKVTDVNGTYVGGNNAYTGTFDPTLKLLLGGAQWNSAKTEPNFGSKSKYLNFKVWGLKIYSEYPSVLVRDYIPVKKSDGTYTLYDTISKTYAVPYGTVTGSE